MARLELITVDETVFEAMLTDFKQYASVPDDTQDEMLLRIIRNAALRVQEYADKAFVRCTVRATLAIPVSGIVRLYLGGGVVSEVKNDRGEAMSFDYLPGGRLQLFAHSGTAQVTYDVEPNQGDIYSLEQAIIRYATADYDGAETDELNRILTESVL